MLPEWLFSMSTQRELCAFCFVAYFIILIVQVCRDGGAGRLHCTSLAVVPEGTQVHSWMGRPLPKGKWEQVGNMHK